MIQRTFEKLYDTGISKSYVKWAEKGKEIVKNGEKATVTNYEKLQDYFPIGLMAWLSLIQCVFFARSKEMPDDKKATLISNEIYTAALGVAVSLATLKHTKNLKEKFTTQAKKMFKGDMYKNGIDTAIPIVFSVVFCQYLAPIVTAPFATMTTKYLIKKGKIKDPNAQNPLDIKG